MVVGRRRARTVGSIALGSLVPFGCVVSFVRASVFGRTRDDEPSDGARGGNGTVTGETSDRRTVGSGVVVRDADAKAAKARASSRFWTEFIYPFGLDLSIRV